VALEEWWGAGTAPLLVIQGLDDEIAPAGNGHALREQFGERVQVIDLPRAAHFLVLEQPEADSRRRRVCRRWRRSSLTACGKSRGAEMPPYDDTFVDRFLEPWNRHDVVGALALMTDDCVWEITRGREPHATLYTGRADVRSAIVEAFKALPDINYQPVRMLRDQEGL
jgi:SnoaL-like domain